MRERMEGRLAALRQECTAGETQLRRQEQQINSLRETLIRISGAILVLEELLSQAGDVAPTQETRPTECLAVVGTPANETKV